MKAKEEVSIEGYVARAKGELREAISNLQIVMNRIKSNSKI